MKTVRLCRQSILSEPLSDDTYDIYIDEFNTHIQVASFDNQNDAMDYFKRLCVIIEKGQKTLETDDEE